MRCQDLSALALPYVAAWYRVLLEIHEDVLVESRITALEHPGYSHQKLLRRGLSSFADNLELCA